MISLALTLVLIAFVVRLLQVQAVDASAYAAKAAQNRYVDYVVAAERGEITDRSGVALATSVDAYTITADPTLFTRKQLKIDDGPEQAAALLAPILGVDQASLVKKLRPANKNLRYVVLANRQTPQVWKQIKDLKSALTTKSSTDPTTVNVLAGVLAVPTTKRVYPNGDLAAGILGWVNADGKGGGGVEQQLNKDLTGKDGKVRYAQSGGVQVPTAGSTETPAVPGSDVELTIDRDIQWAAQNAITEQVKKSKADRGYVIVQDTRTGEILAMANAPGFDPNDLAQANAASLGNAALQDAYEPGSTAKVMTMAAVLQENAATPLTHVVVPNRLHRGDRLFQDDVDHATWNLTLNGVLAKSSNIGTIEAAGQLGTTQPQANEVLYSYLRKFGIGSYSGLNFPVRPRASSRPPPSGRPRSSTRFLSARACPSTPSRRPPCTRRSPTAGSGSSPPWCVARRDPTVGSRPRRRPRRPGSSVRRRRRPSPRCWSPWWTTSRARAVRPPFRGTGWRARPAPPTAWIRPPASTRATPRRSPGSRPPTTPASPSTARSRTPPAEATSAVRSADRSTSR